MIELLTNLSEEDANIRLLLLTSAGIAFHVSGDAAEGWTILVWPDDHDAALAEIESYDAETILAENGRPCHPDDTESWYDNTGGLWAALTILVSHVAIVHNGGVNGYIDKFGLSATAVRHGELYRVVTALMLHSGAVHLVGNLAGVMIFITPVCSIQGMGVGLLSTVLSGALGNYFTALLYYSHHVSIGASTAIFGAVGILSAHQFFRKFRDVSQRFHAWLPLGGGICLLGLFSAGANTDIVAHFMGFICGVAWGCLYEVCIDKRLSHYIQYMSLAAVLGILLASWMRLY